jgi:hypothetical protein
VIATGIGLTQNDSAAKIAMFLFFVLASSVIFLRRGDAVGNEPRVQIG